MRPARYAVWCLPGVLLLLVAAPVAATPANRAALARAYDRFLPKRLDTCATCHQIKTPGHLPTSLSEAPHNAFGARLVTVAAQLRAAGKSADIAARLTAVAKEDSDGDGVDNETEILLGSAPGDSKNRPTPLELASLPTRRAEFARFLASYRWRPFNPVTRPKVPDTKGIGERMGEARNPIDAFLAVEWVKRGLKPRPEAPKAVLLRRVYLDLIGLQPSPQEIHAFEKDRRPDAYERVVDRLLNDPRHGERWARHWMDVWRYSDWAGWADGGQIRDSKPHIWRWRDWIVESLNRDKPYDRMVVEMLAADELTPDDPDALRATGFLVRNYKLLSREQWLEDTVGHTAKAFLGLTLHCAKCHDHMYDPIPQEEYYRVRAVFEPHNVRTDRIPGQLDTAKDGLVRAYDADAKAVTYFYPRGDERHPDKDRPMKPGVLTLLGGAFEPKPVSLPHLAALPDRREFVVKDTLAASEKAVAEAKSALEKEVDPAKRKGAQFFLNAATARHHALIAILEAERLEDAGQKNSAEWKRAATEVVTLQRAQALAEARQSFHTASVAVATAEAKSDAAQRKNDKAALDAATAEVEKAHKALTDAEKLLKEAEAKRALPPATDFVPRKQDAYPETSTGRRLAFARWIADRRNPLTARVAVNHVWARHFGTGLVPSLSDFGRNGRPPSHPELLDWLSAAFAAKDEGGKTKDSKDATPSSANMNWSFKRLHRLIVTSRAYRMDSRPNDANTKRDPDNVYLWRMPSRRMEAELVRDNVLYAAGSLDPAMGGPEIDHNEGLTSRRRSLYLRTAAEKQAEFLTVFDAPSVTECYERRPSVLPQQALALANSALALREARTLAKTLSAQTGSDNVKFVENAFLRVLARRPTVAESRLCRDFLNRPTVNKPTTAALFTQAENSESQTSSSSRPRENLLLVLFNHNDFVTIR